MLGIGNTELIIIALFGFLLLGPDKLPVMGRVLGRALRQFRSAQEDITKVMQSEFVDPLQQAASKTESSDETGSSETTQQKKETFAERKARLAATQAGGAARAKGATDSPKDSPSARDETRCDEGSVPASYEKPISAGSDSAEGQKQSYSAEGQKQDVSDTDRNSQELSAFALYGLAEPCDEEDGKA